MTISIKTHKMLWGRSGNRCAMPDCRKELVMDATETDDASLIGEECHIVANSSDGPRGDAAFSEEKLNKYDNLILLCRIHHKLIDDQPNTFTVEKLRTLKSEHEEWVRSSLTTYDSQKQKDDEVYATYIEKWISLSHVSEWEAWTSHVLGADHPSLWSEVDNDLSACREWIFNRIWPRRYGELEDAFENFRRVLQDFQITFHEHAEPRQGQEVLWTRKFYKIDDWDEEKYERLYREYIYHVKLVQDLILELTRAANYICDKVRQFIDSSFRLEEGVLTASSGPYMDLSWRTHRAEYRGGEREQLPYKGLEQFKKDRSHRDYNFGVGVNTADPDFVTWYESLS